MRWSLVCSNLFYILHWEFYIGSSVHSFDSLTAKCKIINVKCKIRGWGVDGPGRHHRPVLPIGRIVLHFTLDILHWEFCSIPEQEQRTEYPVAACAQGVPSECHAIRSLA